jgi:hypothetical protein
MRPFRVKPGSCTTGVLPFTMHTTDQDWVAYPAGMYLVLIRTEQGMITRKVTLRP